jgi:hypothetical protein
MKLKIAFLFLFFSIINFSQTDKANNLLNQIKNKLNEVNDYSANVEVGINMDFLKMPKSKAQLFFKKPDKFKFNSTGFAILPKAGVDFNPQKILEFDLISEIIGDTLFDGKNLKIVQITPKADTLKFNSATLLIDDIDLLIKQIKISAFNGADITTKFKYDSSLKFALPSELNVIFDFTEMAEDDKSKKSRSKMPGNFKGEISIKYSDYKVNLGIDDAVFEEEKEETSKGDKKGNK